MDHNREYHKHISDYLENQKRDILTDDFGYATYTSPNTMFNISNELPEIMINMSHSTLKVWLRCLSLLKRNHDPVLACTIKMVHKEFKDIVGRTSYYKSLKELEDMDMILRTQKQSMYIVNVKMANKLFKPKFIVPDKA